MQSEHSLESLLLNSTSYDVVIIECGSLQPVQTVLSRCRCFFSLVIFYQIEFLMSVRILSISLFYNSESIDSLGLKGHINCWHDRPHDQSLGSLSTDKGERTP